MLKKEDIIAHELYSVKDGNYAKLKNYIFYVPMW